MSISDFSMGGWTSAAIDRISLKIVFYYVIWLLFFGFCSLASVHEHLIVAWPPEERNMRVAA